MPQFRFPRLTPTVKKLLIFLAASFLVGAVLKNLSVPLFQWLALDVDATRNAQALYINLLWQPLTYWMTYPPVPGALMNYVFILLGIYFFLSPFEEGYGPKRTLQLAATGVIAAAIPCILLGFVFPAPPTPIAGASPIALAALGAFPFIAAGGGEIYFMFLVRMRAWHVIALGLGLAAVSSLLASDPFIFVEHAGAIAGGVLYARWMRRPRQRRPRPIKKTKRRSGPDLRLIDGGADDDKPRWLN